jgi:cyclophilin family peptidyl-prolyl cis-trans isomerase
MLKHVFLSILVVLIILTGTLPTGCGNGNTNRTAVIQTNMGTVKVELYEKRAPITIANFIKLVEEQFYDGLIFHRVVDDFMIQTGDPTGTGFGGSDETIELEIHTELRHTDGAVSMARKQDPNSASSQFFICDGAQTYLDDSYAVFGQVIEGIDVVRAIAVVPTETVYVDMGEYTVPQENKPVDNVIIVSIVIE